MAKSINPKRLALIELSKLAKQMMNEGGEYEGGTVNEVLLSMYCENVTGDPGAELEWNTFKGWKDAGRKIVKGSTGFAVWGKPRKAILKDGKMEVISKEEAAVIGDDKELKKLKWWPMAFLFHAGQTEELKNKSVA